MRNPDKSKMKLKFAKIPKFFVTLFIAAVLSASGFGQTGTSRVMPADFKSDGCTWFPDGDYRDCCEDHDKAYYFGGSRHERSVADKQLYACVKERHGKMRARMMWLGVRIGGVSFLPTPFRWGFGNKWPKSKP